MAATRNTAFVVEEAQGHLTAARAAGLMHTSFSARHGKRLTLSSGAQAVEFISCSYLGLDRHPLVVEAASQVVREFGVHFCCARSRLSIEPAMRLEDELSTLFRGHAVTFPSVTAAHLSTLPLLASGVLLPEGLPRRTHLVFDRLAHASMQVLRPILAEEAARVDVIPHNDLGALEALARQAAERGETLVYLADGVYSMGGLCPVKEVARLAERYPLCLYLDDAHGTSIFGAQGEGSVRGLWEGELPENVFLAFSLSKGFGCNGGGVLLPTAPQARRVRDFGVTYAFSAPLDFSVVAAAREVVKLHRDGTVAQLQHDLRTRVAQYDALVGSPDPGFSPIRRVPVGDEVQARKLGEALLARGHFVSVAFFPVVARGQAQLRVCLAVDHQPEEIEGFAQALAQSMAELGLPPVTRAG